MNSGNAGIRTTTNTGANTGIKAMGATSLPISGSVSSSVSGTVPVPVSGIGGVVYRLKGRLRSNTMQKKPVGTGIGIGGHRDNQEGDQSDLNSR